MLGKIRARATSRQRTVLTTMLAAVTAVSLLGIWTAIPLGTTLDFIWLCHCGLSAVVCVTALGILRRQRRMLERVVVCEAEEIAIAAARRHLGGY